MDTDLSLKKLTPDATLAQILMADKDAAHLLTSIGLDPSAHMEETLRAVCSQRQWSEVEVMKWLKNKHASGISNSKENGISAESDFGDDVHKWTKHLEQNFHDGNLELLKDIEDRFPKVKKIHGNQYPQLKNIEWHLDKFSQDYQLYLKFESMKFFPLVERLKEQSKKPLDGFLRKLNRCLDIIEEDQERLAAQMETIREKGGGFKNPTGTCSTLRILNHSFEQLEEGLEEQFQIEKEHIVPLVQRKLDALVNK